MNQEREHLKSVRKDNFSIDALDLDLLEKPLCIGGNEKSFSSSLRCWSNLFIIVVIISLYLFLSHFFSFADDR